MAMTIYASLTYNGTPITGEVGVATIGGIEVRQNHIEVHGFHQEVSLNVDGQAHRTSSTRVLGPIVFTKRVDPASILLLQAWNTNATIAGAFKFFRTDPRIGAQMFHVVQVAGGRIMGVRTEMLNNLTPEGGPMPYLERVIVMPHTITVSNLPGQLETTIEWASL